LDDKDNKDDKSAVLSGVLLIARALDISMPELIFGSVSIIPAWLVSNEGGTSLNN
jgi:hypothetical protein